MPALRLLGLVVATTLAAAGLAELTWDGEGRLVPAAWFLVAVIALSLAGGFGPGLVSAGIGAVVLLVVFSEPRLSFSLDDTSELAGPLGFLLAGAAVSLLLDRLLAATAFATEAVADRDRSLALLDSLLANAPVGLAFLDGDLRFIGVNGALADVDGVPVDEHVGRAAEQLLGERCPEVLTLLQRTISRGTAQLDVALELRRADGSLRHVIAGCYPVHDESKARVGVGLVLRDVTNEMLVETERTLLFERVARLQALTAGLTAAVTRHDVTKVVLEEGSRALDAVGAALGTRTEDDLGIEVVATQGEGGEDLLGEATAHDEQHPAHVALRTGEPVTVETGASPVAFLPLLTDGRPGAVLAVAFPRGHRTDPADRGLLSAVASTCASALDRARLYEAERRARAHAEEAGDRLAFLAEASRALTASLDWEAALRQLAELAVPRLADWCAITVVRGRGTLTTLTVMHADPERVTPLQRLADRYLARPVPGDAMSEVLRTRRPALLPDGPVAILGAARDVEHERLLGVVGASSGVLVPVLVDGTALAVVTLVTEGERRLGDADLALAAELVGRGTQAVTNARLYAERDQIADILQRSLLPSTTPRVPGVELATRFVAGGDAVDVGGDFYDTFPLGGNGVEARTWAVVVGDVRGKGVEAAALTSRARNVLRSASLSWSSPAAMLAHLNDVLLHAATPEDAEGEPRFCTAAMARLEVGDEVVELDLAVAGHPLPFVLRSDGATEQVGVEGTLLGVLPDVEVTDIRLKLGPGDALVLYTDGVTERHADGRYFEEEGLAAVLARCAGFTAETLAERVETAARGFVEDELADDVALLVVRVPERLASSSSASIELPADLTSPRRARAFVQAALSVVGDPSVAEPAELLTSEVVTNAVIHGGAPIRLAIESVDGGIRIAVSDGSPELPTVRNVPPNAEFGRGMGLVEKFAARWGVEPTTTGKSVWFEL